MLKTKIVRISEKNRDFGKSFMIKEKPAYQAEKWAQRAILAIAHAGVDIPSDWRTAGVAALAGAGLQALSNLSFAEAEPLLDEMLTCIEMMPDPQHPEVRRALVLDGDGADIEEITTLFRLRKEIVDLHTGFFSRGVS